MSWSGWFAPSWPVDELNRRGTPPRRWSRTVPATRAPRISNSGMCHPQPVPGGKTSRRPRKEVTGRRCYQRTEPRPELAGEGVVQGQRHARVAGPGAHISDPTGNARQACRGCCPAVSRDLSYRATCRAVSGSRPWRSGSSDAVASGWRSGHQLIFVIFRSKPRGTFNVGLTSMSIRPRAYLANSGARTASAINSKPPARQGRPTPNGCRSIIVASFPRTVPTSSTMVAPARSQAGRGPAKLSSITH